MNFDSKAARHAHQESREYRGLYRVRKLKTRAARLLRRRARQVIKTADHDHE